MRYGQEVVGIELYLRQYEKYVEGKPCFPIYVVRYTRSVLNVAVFFGKKVTSPLRRRDRFLVGRQQLQKGFRETWNLLRQICMFSEVGENQGVTKMTVN